MANSIALAEQYTSILDEKYKKSALTNILEVQDEFLQGFNNAGTIQILSVATDGLGDYDRATGFPAGSTTATWESHTIDNDRGQSFQIDSMDNAEAGGRIFVETARQFMMQEVIPEVDAVRFNKMASAGTTPVEAALADGDAEELSEADGLTDALGDTLGDSDADGEMLGDSDALGLVLADGLTLGLTDALGETDGDSDADGLSEGDSDALGETLGLSLADGDTLGDSEAEGLTLGDSEADGETEADGLTDGDSLALGDTEALGETDGLSATAAST